MTEETQPVQEEVQEVTCLLSGKVMPITSALQIDIPDADPQFLGKDVIVSAIASTNVAMDVAANPEAFNAVITARKQLEASAQGEQRGAVSALNKLASVAESAEEKAMIEALMMKAFQPAQETLEGEDVTPDADVA